MGYLLNKFLLYNCIDLVFLIFGKVKKFPDSGLGSRIRDTVRFDQAAFFRKNQVIQMEENSRINI